MNQIEQLLTELRPDGVEFRQLGEVVRIRNGRDYKHLNTGYIPVYGSGGVMTYVDKFIYNLPSVLIPRKGSLGNLYYLDKPFWSVDTIFYTEIGDDLNAKYFFYYLQTLRLEKMNQAAGVPSQTQSNLNKIKIPIPPLAFQEEIVRILDKFVELQTELQTELQKRKIQYEYYRNALLTFPSSGQRMIMLFFLGYNNCWIFIVPRVWSLGYCKR